MFSPNELRENGGKQKVPVGEDMSEWLAAAPAKFRAAAATFGLTFGSGITLIVVPFANWRCIFDCNVAKGH
jgi:hypothetical protein